MTAQIPLPLGVVEGFYGRPWSHENRLAYADYLPGLGLNSYLYCPKSDPYLRKRWKESWPRKERGELEELSRRYDDKGLQWGVGLSPFALYQNYDDSQRQALRRKVAELSDLGISFLAVLFDDMPGDQASLAERQAEIVADVCRWAPNVRIMTCPTYYSFDPVLETHFGAMPANYWEQLGALVSPDVDIFWTGNKVCSESISIRDLELIECRLGRQVMLWDNYPVNDGALRSNYLYSDKMPARCEGIADKVRGHFCNPMNQSLVSLMALAGLGELYSASAVESKRLIRQVYGDATYTQLQLDKANFEECGLKDMSVSQLETLSSTYAALGTGAACEVAQWLRGEYTFDPACLTD